MEPEQTPVAPQESEAHAALARRLADNIASAVQVRSRDARPPDGGAARRGARAGRGLSRGRQDRAGARRWPARSTASSRACSARRTCCPPTWSAPTSTTSASSASSSGPGRCSPTSCWSTRSTAPRPRPSRGCSSACRSAASPSTSTPTSWRARSWCWPPRTRSSTRAPTRCPRPRSTGSWSGSRSAIPSRGAEAGMLADHETGDRVLTLRAGGHRRRGARRPGRRHAGARVGAAARLHRAPAVAHARGSPRRPRREPPRRPAAAARRQGPRDDAGPRPCAARRRPGARASRCSSHRLVLAPESPRGAGEDVVADAVVVGAGAVMSRARPAVRRRRRAAGADPVRRCCSTPRRCSCPASRSSLLGARRAGVGLVRGRRGAASSAQLHADRVVEDEPLEATIEVRRGAWGLPGGRAASTRSPARRCRLRGRCRRSAAAAIASVRVVAALRRAAGVRRSTPPSLIVHDPLDLARAVRRGAGPPQRAAGAAAHRARAVAARRELSAPEPPTPDTRRPSRWRATEVDGLRPYRPGTPASRIHWPALARGAGLLERRLQADGDTRPLVVLDARWRRPRRAPRRRGPAAASLTLELARAGRMRPAAARGAAAARRRPRPGQPGRRPRPPGAGRGRARAQAPALASGARRGRLFYVAAQPTDRLPASIVAGCHGIGVLVLPTPLADGLGLPSAFEVTGCRGFMMGTRTRSPSAGSGRREL